ncbi:MAG: hypothetical protein Q8P50_18575 [Bacillota bacterium]|nr:hypothetical protein [Bacillota bacterium]
MNRWPSSIHWMANTAIPQALFTSLSLVSLVKIHAMKMGQSAKSRVRGPYARFREKGAVPKGQTPLRLT